MKPLQHDLTKDQIDAAYEVDLERGIFIRKFSAGRGKKGDIAGSISANGYRLIYGGGKKLLTAHRLMWFYVNGVWPETDIDHINGNKDDNRIGNLRLAHRSENNINAKTHKHNTSGFKGVSFDNRRKHWVAYIWVFKKRYYLGSFGDREKAFAAYQAASVKYYGEFAKAAA